MKICILRRDGENINYGMIDVVLAITEEYFGEKELFINRNEKEFTQMLTFSVPNNEDSSKILKFIIAVSDVNSLYSVRILK